MYVLLPGWPALAAAATDGSLDRATGAQAGCLRAPPPWQDATVAAALRSELDADAALVPPGEDQSDLPLILLAAPAPPADAGTPPEVEQARRQTQSRLLASSRQGRRVDLTGTSHDVQLDRPQAVAAAIETVLARPATWVAVPAK